MAEDLIIEAIRMHGVNVYYMPKEIVNMDEIFGEDGLIKFENAVKIEMYVKNPAGFGGQGKMLAKLGIEIREEVIFTCSVKRFEECRAEHLLTETGQNFEQELTYRYAPNQVNGILLEAGDIEGYYVPFSRPKEGDLIYVPFAQKIFDIKYVDQDATFYQFGNLHTFDITCEVMEYSSERLNTGYSEIDGIEDQYTLDSQNSIFHVEDGDNLTDEDGGTTITEEYTLTGADPTANNNSFTREADDIIDFSEKNPWTYNSRW
jgi:hypothetical protein